MRKIWGARTCHFREKSDRSSTIRGKFKIARTRWKLDGAWTGENYPHAINFRRYGDRRKMPVYGEISAVRRVVKIVRTTVCRKFCKKNCARNSGAIFCLTEFYLPSSSAADFSACLLTFLTRRALCFLFFLATRAMCFLSLRVRICGSSGVSSSGSLGMTARP